MTTQILSVGIDIGTSTTQVIFSYLTLENLSSLFTVPRVEIVDKKIVYRSEIYFTPLLSETLIDGEGVKAIVKAEYAKAGFSPSDTGAGAVIITGESARKENADEILRQMSSFAGDFVVATAGPDLESIMAGKGSGAWQYSYDNKCVVANLDIGGGTTNISVFDSGKVIARGCLDIGGRLVRVAEGKITYISKSVQHIAADINLKINIGDYAELRDLVLVAKRMAELLEEALYLRPKTALLEKVTTRNSSPLALENPPEYFCLSGGVAELVYRPADNTFEYGDIGAVLANEIAKSQMGPQALKLSETIRATVVGAGTFSTTISGSTISFTRDILPIKNIPALIVDDEQRLFKGDKEYLEDNILWFQSQLGGEFFLLGLKGKKNPQYSEIKQLAGVVSEVMGAMIPPNQPIIVVVEHDIAKALGQVIMGLSGERPVICIDGVALSQGDYVDIGEPLMNGIVVPVVVKTVVLG